MAIGDRPISDGPIADTWQPEPGLPTFPPITIITRWSPANSGSGTTFGNENRLARTSGTGTAICDTSKNVSAPADIVAEIDFFVDPQASPNPIYFGLATASSNTELLPGSDTSGWAVKLEYVGQTADESRFQIFYRHNGVDTYLGNDYLINNEFLDPIGFVCVLKTGNGNIQAQVGTDQDDTWPPQFPVDVNVGTDNLQANDEIFITVSNIDYLVYLNGDNAAGFTNADDLYPGGIAWDDYGVAGVRVYGEHYQILEYAKPIDSAHRQSISDALIYDHQQQIIYVPSIRAEHAQLMNSPVEQFHVQRLLSGAPLTGDHIQPIEHGYPIVRADHRQLIGYPVLTDHRQLIDYGARITAHHTQRIQDGASILSDHTQPISDKDRPLLLKEHRQPAPILGEPTTIITDQPALFIGEKKIEILRAEIHSDDGSPFWQSSITLASPSDYAKFTRDMEFELDLYGTRYALIVDTRQLSRSFSGNQPADEASLTALSPGAKRGTPRADAISATWEINASASTIAASVLGAPIAWNILNWIVPAYRYGVSDATPIVAAQQIIESVGGLLLSNPDGGFVAVKRFPVNPADFDNAAVAATLTESDIFESVETISAERIINKQRIADIFVSYADTLEFVPDEQNPLYGTLRAYPSPWTTSVRLRDTTGSLVQIYPSGTETREETETIEIREGRGSVRYPIHSIESVTYLQDDLGGVSFEVGSAELSTAQLDWSLMIIVYTTKSITARAESTVTTKSQILLERND